MTILPALGVVAYAYSNNSRTTPELTLDMKAGDIAQITFTYTCGGKIYGDIYMGTDPGYRWQYVVSAGNIGILSFPGGDFQTLGCVANCLTTSVSVTSLIQCYATSTVTLTVGGNVPRTCFVNSNWSLLGKVIGRAHYDTPPPAPTSTFTYDPQNWAQTVENVKSISQKWVPNYQVRYAVSCCNESGESALGPWTDWISGPWAYPKLINIPLGTPGITSSRNIYRQFDGFAQELLGSIPNNLDTTFADDKS